MITISCLFQNADFAPIRTYPGSKSPLVKVAKASYNDNKLNLSSTPPLRQVQCNRSCRPYKLAANSFVRSPSKVNRRQLLLGRYHYPTFSRSPRISKYPAFCGIIAECQPIKPIYQGLYSDSRYIDSGPVPNRLKRKCEAAVYAFVIGSKSATLFEPSSARPPTSRMRGSFGHISSALLHFNMVWRFE